MPKLLNIALKGEGDKDKKKVETKTTTVAPTVNRFAAWGNLSDVAPKQGWYPVRWDNETTEYRNANQNLFNQVVLPGTNKRGYLSVTGGNKNGVFDLVVKDYKGNTIQPLLQKVPASQIDMYFRNANSTVAGRANSVAAGTNPDRYMPDGSYTALK